MSSDVICKENCVIKCPNRLVDKIFIDSKSKPNCKFLFTTCKLGKPLWKQPPASDFTFYDPHNRESSAEYNPLRDPFLKPFFSRKANLLNLQKKNLISDKNEVICGAKEFNDYRKVLHRLSTERRAVDRKALAADDLDDHRVKISNDVFKSIEKKKQRFLSIYDRKNYRCSTSGILRHESVVEIMKLKKSEQERVRMEKFKAKVERYNQRLCEIRETNRLKRKIVKERAVYRTMDIENKKAFVQAKLRSFQIKTMKRMAVQDKKVKELLEKRNDDRPKSCPVIVRCPMKDA